MSPESRRSRILKGTGCHPRRRRRCNPGQGAILERASLVAASHFTLPADLAVVPISRPVRCPFPIDLEGSSCAQVLESTKDNSNRSTISLSGSTSSYSAATEMRYKANGATILCARPRAEVFRPVVARLVSPCFALSLDRLHRGRDGWRRGS